MHRLIIISVLIAISLSGCNLAQLTVTPVPPTQQPSWVQIAEGLEWRSYVPDDNLLYEIVALRINPALYKFRAHYRPGNPLYANGWQSELPDAIAFINANFFTPENEILGLLIADGVVYGQSYRDRGGMFAVQNGIPTIRSNITQPYQDEVIEQAIQAFPMLITNGQPVPIYNASDSITRRSAIGQDAQGRIIIMATPQLGLSLPEFAQYLASTDMQLVNAFNLDGGGSTMLYVNGDYEVASFDPVPAVLAVYKKR